ncbi:sigma 54-interacting transcriptional regulator [Clostridioides sp. ES-S-0048-02]|uniref:sigma-54 interaction domain-containing protein n=1 Tax=Clostridioides sp. ES-S-0048-02 TaxID=2770777 RepID=UPI001D0FD73F|nr:sigma 54-interacting transcriptional regulator [Clostridioides sp. ES-S-0048-02]
MKEHWYKDIFARVLSMTDDGFIVVNKDGVIIDINDKYCDFLGKERDDIIGHNIQSIIPNTKMLDIMRDKYCEEGAIHHYLGGKTKEKSVIVSRSYVENDNGEVVAGVAQVKFRLQSFDVAKKLMSEYMELQYYKEQFKDKCSFDKLIGENRDFIELKKTGMKASKTNFSVLLTGETGTGKEVFARAIHNNSSRADKPMVSINCAAIPEELLESELFGYDEGAFTGAKKGGKKGKFLVANNGTIFLDEIGDMPLTMQAKLLRVLQESEIEPVGGLKTIKIDVRVISATRKNLSKMVEEGLFREDLYYRLNVINIHMMELKDRQDDILLLANYILNKLNVEYKELKVLSDKVKNCFINYIWPGNIRELQNVIKSAYAVSDDMVIMMCDLPSKMDNISRVAQCNVDSNCSIHEMVENYEKSLIIDVLRKYNWKCSKAAEVMGIHKSLLYKKIKKYEIELNN